MPDTLEPIVCLACLRRQRRIVKPCEKCSSRRLAYLESLRQKHGDNWKEILEADRGKVH